MKAIVQRRFGGPDVLEVEEVPLPEPGPGRVRIDVAAAGVHLLDTAIRRGETGGPFPPPELPVTPGREVAGVVGAVGDERDRDWLGRRVVAHLGMASGGYAEHAVAPVEALIPLQEQTDPAAAVAMVGTGRTALAVLAEAAITADDVVIVTGAAGGLGALLVQAAHAAGATVAGLAGGERKVELVRAQGADVAVDYRQDGWGERIAAELGDRAPTVLLDGVGGTAARTAFELLRPGGRVVLFGYSSGRALPLTAEDLFARGVSATAAIGPRLLSRPGGIHAFAVEAVAQLEAGRLRPLVHPPFPLADAAEAHRALEARETAGKVVLVP